VRPGRGRDESRPYRVPRVWLNRRNNPFRKRAWDDAGVRVTLDVSAAAQGRGGIGRYSARLAEALRAVPDVALSLLYNGPRQTRLASELWDLPARRVPLRSKPWRAGVALTHLARLPLDRWLRGSDLFHATDHLLPFLRRTPTVFTVHDLAFLERPETHLPSNRAYLTLMMPRFVRAATAIIADSEATRRGVLRHYGVPSDKVRVVHLGVERAFRPVEGAAARARVAARYDLAAPYVLFVGTLEPRKNVRGLLLAYRRLLQGWADTGQEVPHLAIAGARGWWYRELFRLARAQGLDGVVRFLGRVADEDLPALYSAAAAFVYPSLYEGFGLPPLEALACGAPVVCSNRASLPEVVGDAALQVDPTRTGEIAAALERVLTDGELRGALRARGLARAAEFTWERTGAETARLYREVLGEET
jgi:glycosyltransferase involved in cell wall biosynthesis